MTQSMNKPVVQVQPQPSIYTVLIIVAILALAVTIGMVLYDLMSASGYGMGFGEVLNPLKEVPPGAN